MKTPSEDIDDEGSQAAHETSHSDEPPAKKRRVSTKDEALGPSCYACRRKKTKCSRDQPCSNCSRLDMDCVYDSTDRTKPGVRTGAIENLSQRLATLENMFLGQSVMWQQIWNCVNRPPDRDSGYSPGSHQQSSSIGHQSQEIKDTLMRLAPFAQADRAAMAQNSQSFTESPASGISLHPAPFRPGMQDAPELPPDDLVDSLVDIYFREIHPWIPMLHFRKFRASLANATERRRITTILNAIVSVTIRFSDDPRLEKNPDLRPWYATRCRQTVILESMESFSVENLQALIICAFDTIGSGKGPSSWSIVNSMTRTVEQLGLSTEDDELSQHSASSNVLIKRMAFLPIAKSWREVEERRRVFWNVFLLDRFCSITTGWNLSLTNADVARRLPFEGAIWQGDECPEASTPYFGVGVQTYNRENDALPTGRSTEDEGQSLIGGFAFCIEATESLSLVTSFFLQHEVDVKKMRDVQRWFTRFKQLDLRLVQWKVFLPEQWREACVVTADGNMDQNLTLAHITHNASVVLLHQGIAYPSPEWSTIPVKLPSASSAETCHAAAVEVSTIAARFLQKNRIVTSPQFSFCLFVCGRCLLAHAAYYKAPLSAAFDSIVGSLNDLANRWNGKHVAFTPNLASKFAARLVRARQDGANPVDIREPAFSEKNNAVSLSRPDEGSGSQINLGTFQSEYPSGAMLSMLDSSLEAQEGPYDRISLAFPPLPMSFQAQSNEYLPQPGSPSLNGGQDISPGAENAFPMAPYDGGELYSFLNQTFLPDQRVSMFSQSGTQE